MGVAVRRVVPAVLNYPSKSRPTVEVVLFRTEHLSDQMSSSCVELSGSLIPLRVCFVDACYHRGGTFRLLNDEVS